MISVELFTVTSAGRQTLGQWSELSRVPRSGEIVLIDGKPYAVSAQMSNAPIEGTGRDQWHKVRVYPIAEVPRLLRFWTREPTHEERGRADALDAERSELAAA